MKVLVTGAGGFLGKHVVHALVERGHEVRALVRPKSSLPEGWQDESSIEVFRADLRSKRGLEELCAGIDCVVHLAAAKSGDFYDQFGGTVIATENLIEAMRDAGVNRMVLTSSFSVYEYLKRPAKSEISEDSPLAQDPEARDEYCRTKLLQERLARRVAKQHSWSLVVLRPGVIFGRDNLWNGRVGFPVSARWWVCTAPFSTVPLCYVENCADAIAHAVERIDDLDGATLNLLDDGPPSHWQYLKEFGAQSETKVRIIPMPWWVMRALAGLAALTNRVLFGGNAKLPGLLVPSRVHARCKPMRYGNDAAKEALAWEPGHTWAHGVDRSI